MCPSVSSPSMPCLSQRISETPSPSRSRCSISGRLSSRIPVRIEQHRLGGEQLARAVDLDRTTFQDHSSFENPHPESRRDTSGDRVVQIPWREFTAPGVEPPIRHRHLAIFAVLHKDRPVIAAPNVVVRVIEKLHPLRHRLRPVAGRGDRGMIRARRVDANRLVAGNRGGDLRELRPHRIPLGTPPVAGIIHRPRKPNRFLRRPFGWHRKSSGGSVHARKLHYLAWRFPALFGNKRPAHERQSPPPTPNPTSGHFTECHGPRHRRAATCHQRDRARPALHLPAMSIRFGVFFGRVAPSATASRWDATCALSPANAWFPSSMRKFRRLIV